MTSSTKTHTFEADIQKILHILIRSVYSNRDVFLRELISNASDAIDKVRVLKMNANEDTKGEYNIHVRVSEGNVLEIFDNGIGMDVDDLQKNLSTIAHSGTSDFVEKLKDKKDMSQFIGQFGVGFYACFLVSSNVEVLTRKWNTDKVWKWTSDGVSTYSVEEYDGEWSGDMTHGTFIRLQLKEDSEEYGKEETLKKIIQQHSSFISYPVKLWVEKEKEEEKPAVDTVEEEDGEEEVAVEEVDGEETTKEDAKEPEKMMVKYNEWEQVNGAKPLWYKEPSEITNEEYTELFRTMKKTSNPADNPLYWKHFKAEGKHEFQGVFYFSSKPTTDAFVPQNTPERNIRLYVKKVMIMENCGKELIPEWMCFVSGIVDSNDLPLNVSREMLQNNQMVRSMNKYMVKQVYKMLAEFMVEDRTKYEVFYNANSHFLKWGITEKEPKLMDYLMFATSLDTSKKITLDEYVENHLVEGQKEIFFMTGDTVDEIETSIFLERFKERNICVLYMTDPIDEFIMQHVRNHKEHSFVDIGKEFESTLFDDLKEGKTVDKATKASLYTQPKSEKKAEEGEEEAVDNETEKPKRPFLEFVMECLQKESIDEIRQSVRLTTTPACLVTKKYGWTGHMTKIMKSQPLQDKSYLMMANLPKIWEVNLDHNLIVDLKTKYDEETVSNEELSKRINVLYKITTVQSGYTLDNTTSFCKDLFEMLENPL